MLLHSIYTQNSLTNVLETRVNIRRDDSDKKNILNGHRNQNLNALDYFSFMTFL